MVIWQQTVSFFFRPIEIFTAAQWFFGNCPRLVDLWRMVFSRCYPADFIPTRGVSEGCSLTPWRQQGILVENLAVVIPR